MASHVSQCMAKACMCDTWHAMCQHAWHLWTLYKGLHTWGLRSVRGSSKEKRKGGKEKEEERKGEREERKGEREERKEKKKGEEERKKKEEEEGVLRSEQTQTAKNPELRYKR